MLSLFEALNKMILSDQPEKLELLTKVKGRTQSRLNLRKFQKFLNQSLGEVVAALSITGPPNDQDAFKKISSIMGTIENMEELVNKILNGTLIRIE